MSHNYHMANNNNNNGSIYAITDPTHSIDSKTFPDACTISIELIQQRPLSTREKCAKYKIATIDQCSTATIGKI